MGNFGWLKKIFRKSLLNEHDFYARLKDDCTYSNGLIFSGKLLQRAYKKYPNNLALIGKERSISYRELFFRALSLSNKLKQQGIQPRDRVLLYCENSLDFYVAYWAIWQCAAVAVPINIYLHERELAHVINDAAPRLIIVSSQYQTNLDKFLHTELLVQLPQIMLIADAIDWEMPIPERFDEDAALVELPELPSDELCLLLYTSGTTGLPKGVMLSSKNIVTNVLQVAARIRMCNLCDGERFFCVLPLFHVFAQNVCIWVPAMTGSSVIVVQKIDRRLISEGLAHKPTLFIGVPALYGLLCLMKTAQLDSVKFFVSGADMLPDKIRSAFSMIYGRKIASGYGLTESSPVIAINYKNYAEPTDTVGPVLRDIDCDIRDDSGLSLPIGQVGTLWVRGDNVMLGYYNLPEATTQILHDGWLNTGDLGMIDHRGNLAIKGRLKDVIIHKGFNIYPAEIENVLLAHPSVLKAAVVGQAEEMSGEVPVAFLAVKTKDKGLEKELRDLCFHNLATYKIPRKFVYLEDLPMNATGKIDKKQLRA